MEYGFFVLSENVDEPFETPSKKRSFDMFFFISDSVLHDMNYTGSLKDFSGHLEADYYEITPQNDLLYTWFVTLGDRDFGYAAQCLMSATNPTQTRWSGRNKNQ